MASRMVGWKWLAIISLTGLLTTAVDVPKSSRRQLPTQRKYCTTSGSSSPSCVWSAAISAAVASSPSIAAAGSPGVRCTSRKMTTDTMKMVGMSDSSRLSTYFFMLFLLSRDGGAPLRRRPKGNENRRSLRSLFGNLRAPLLLGLFAVDFVRFLDKHAKVL